MYIVAKQLRIGIYSNEQASGDSGKDKIPERRNP